MLKGFNEWYLDVDLTPTLEQMEARMRGIEAFAEDMGKEDVCDLVRIYFGISINAAAKESFVKYFSEEDPAFSARNEDELKLLAGASLVYLAEEETCFNHLAELLSIIMAEYRHPVSSVRILNRLRQRFDMDRQSLRGNSEDWADDTGNAIDVAINALDAEMGEDGEWSSEAQNKLLDILGGFQKENKGLFSDMRRELSVFKEDSQILWWMSAHWSNTYQVPLKQLDKDAACLPLGVEAAEFVSNYPGPFSMKGVIYHVMDGCKGKSAALLLTDVIKATGDEWKAEQSEQLQEERFLSLLPIHAAIVRSRNTTSEEQWYPKYVEDVLCGEKLPPVTPREYAWRIYLEKLAIKCLEEL